MGRGWSFQSRRVTLSEPKGSPTHTHTPSVCVLAAVTLVKAEVVQAAAVPMDLGLVLSAVLLLLQLYDRHGLS